jgi:polyisoprenoid-binding protein YceI
MMTTWKIDPAHSAINFTVRHMMISNVRGGFEKFDGKVEFNEENPEDSNVEVRIDAASINTREEKRDAHLRSADFLDVENHPYISFRSTRIERAGDDTGILYGDLTIRDETIEVPLHVQFNGLATSPWGQTSAGFTADGKFNRRDWGLEWNQALETGGVLVGDEVKIDIELEIIRQETPEAEPAGGE